MRVSHPDFLGGSKGAVNRSHGEQERLVVRRSRRHEGNLSEVSVV